MGSISLQVPEGAEEGDVLTFDVDGHSMELQLPPGSRPGDVLEIQVAGDEQDQSQDTEAAKTEDQTKQSTEVMLSSGEIVELAGSLPNSDGECSHGRQHIADEESSSSDGTHAMVWQSGVCLAKYVTSKVFQKYMKIDDSMKNLSVLEIGSGLGLGSIAFGCALSKLPKSVLAQAEIVVTDVPSALPLLSYNIQKNGSMIDSARIGLRVTPLVWDSNLDPVPMTTSLDWIVGSDILYNHQNIPELISTIRRLITKSTNILIGVRWRKPELERSFFSELDDLVDWKLVDGTCPLGWQEFGNPSCEASNLFFAQTMIGVRGIPISLGNIDEAKVEEMRKDEYNCWDKMFIQCYVGSRREEPMQAPS